MFDASKMAAITPISRVRDRINSMLHYETFNRLCSKVVHDRTLVYGLKGDSGRSVSIEIEDDGALSLTGYPVSGKTAFESFKAGRTPANDFGGLILGLSENDCLEYIYEIVR